ncbi:hypothetical protein [Bryobacter aggregatus]|uniref:hypothetical protein n=1 Tax=Bryobacter aggregatus TaxID=360054 RepID=UPI0004E26272|nr:hypothetical protein [Bryobacter aggregatus]
MQRSHLYLSFLIAATFASGQSLAPGNLELKETRAEQVTYKGRPAIRVTEAAGTNATNTMTLVKNTSFDNGTIEVEISGDTAPNAPLGQRVFVGIAFRVANAQYECFYIRPKNGRSADQLQRNHSTQYISEPGYPWEKLREETPGKYESYVDLVPGEWTKLKIEVSGKTARLFVGNATQPVLVVQDLKQPLVKGAIGLWVGPGTIAHFADLRIQP